LHDVSSLRQVSAHAVSQIPSQSMTGSLQTDLLGAISGIPINDLAVHFSRAFAHVSRSVEKGMLGNVHEVSLHLFVLVGGGLCW